MRLTAGLLFVLALSWGLENARGDDAGDEGTKPQPSGISSTPSDDLQLPRPFKESRKGHLRLGPAAEEQALQGSVDPAAVRTEIPSGQVAQQAKVRARPNQNHNRTAVDFVCGNEKCDRHEVCVYKQEMGIHACVRMKPFRSGRRQGHFQGHGQFHAHGHPRGHNHGQGHVFHASAKFSKKLNNTELERHRKIQKLKVHAREFQDHHDQRFKLSATTDKIMKLRTKKFIDGNTVENNTSDKWNKECRQRDMDSIGRRLLDQFKMSQDEDLDRQKGTNRRRKEKRNSTKKELHDDDECICQAPVSWQFQQLDTDIDGHLSQAELANVTTQGVCFSQFVVTCDHDKDGNLTEKEWCCCFADILPPCLALMKNVPTLLLRGMPMVLPGAFVPKCDDEGFFSQVQCHAGACWCVNRNGVRYNDYASTESPECNSGLSLSPSVTQIV